MTRALLALAALLTLTLNGSIVIAATPHSCAAEQPCTISLRMLAPPPARPIGIALPTAADRGA